MAQYSRSFPEDYTGKPLASVVRDFFIKRKRRTWGQDAKRVRISATHLRSIAYGSRTPSRRITARLATLMRCDAGELERLRVDQAKISREKVKQSAAEVPKNPPSTKSVTAQEPKHSNRGQLSFMITEPLLPSHEELFRVVRDLEWNGPYNDLWSLRTCVSCGQFEPSDATTKCIAEEHLNPASVGHTVVCRVGEAIANGTKTLKSLGVNRS